jgi:hypothetical protein
MMMLKAEGRRLYFEGAPFAAKDRIKALGAASIVYDAHSEYPSG